MTGVASTPRRGETEIQEKREVATDTCLLRCSGPGKDPFHPLPGQYVTFRLQREGKPVTRSYSITSDPTPQPEFELVVKRVEGGLASNLLCDAAVGDRFNVILPLGKFAVHEPGDRQLLFVATGTGIAPFFPMVRSVRHRFPDTRTSLVVGYRYPADLILNDRWVDLAREWDRFQLLNVLSRPDAPWTGRSGHVQDVLGKDFPDLSHYDVYICGAPEMVTDVQSYAIDHGTPKDRVFVERY